MTLTTPTNRTIAAEEFDRRRTLARQAVNQGRWSADQANAALLPWLANAAAAGADLPELYEEADQIYPVVATVQLRLSSDEICPRERRLAELARARDAAFAKHDAGPSAETLARARNLRTLADALGAPPFNPARACPEQGRRAEPVEGETR